MATKKQRILAEIMGKVDWADISSVTNFASCMGPGHSVVQYAGRDTYNIIHTENESRLGETDCVYWRT